MMGSIIIISILFVVLIAAQVLFRFFFPQERKERVYPIVRAGSVDGAIRPMRSAVSIANLKFTCDGKTVMAMDYIPYIVDGESMAENGIHSNDIVLTEDLYGEDRMHLKEGTVLVFTYTDKDGTGSVGYKLRQFISYLRVNDDFDVDKWCEDHAIKELSQFKRKLEKARALPKHDTETYLCSKTWHDNKLDYSFHSMVNLKGRVCYCIPAEKLE